MTNLEKGKISGSQLVYLVTSFLLGATVVILPAQAAQESMWIAILIGAIEGTIFTLIFTTLARRFPEKTLVEILEAVFGPYLGKIISLIFLWYFFHVGSLVIRNFTDFFTTAIMPETPSVVFAALLILVSAFAVGNGLEVITRCSVVLVPLTGSLLLIVLLLQLKQLDFNNFLPLFEIPLGELLKSSHSAAIFPFGEGVVFLMILPFLNQTNEGRSRMVTGNLVAGFFILLGAWRVIGVLGAVGGILTYPTYESVRLINLPFINIRFEIIIVINYLAMGFLKIAVYHYSTVLGLGQVLKLRTIRSLIIPIGILMIILSLINFSGFAENIEFNATSNLIYSTFFQLGIPLLTLIVAMIRRLPRRDKGC